ncbi:MAG: FAD-dependent monooxygenase [Spirochaetia bacterium]|jgi:2-polyprenyl-6-methoxyphenol hydroxylase-like FAD-dependent oxidoreductase|nr:FAD-dependent monooxygenase [Spirochaetia bacterium]
MENKKILIIGAGISGLSLAINLKKLNIPFRIIEKQAEWNKKGLAMSIQGEGLDAAANMGILTEIKASGVKRNLQRIENSKGKILKEIKTVSNDQSFVIRRDVLHEALRLRVPEVEMDLSVLDFKETQTGLNTTLSDGSSDNFSLAVGADGVNSETSKQITHNTGLLNIEKNTTFSGSVLWGITVSKKYKEIIEIWNKNKMVALYPVDHGTVISFFRKAPKTFQSPRLERADHIKKYFSNFTHPIIMEVLKNLPENIFFDHVRYTRPKKWYSGRITLIGDACHSLSPLSGLGANLAMADAEGLAQVIYKNGKNDDFLDILEEYNRTRKEKADEAYYLSKMRTRRGMLNSPKTILRNRNMKQSGWMY